MKDLMKNIGISIGIAAFIFCVICIAFDIGNSGNFTMTGYSFTKMVTACILTGIGFGAPTIVYSKENIPYAMGAVIHMGIGCVVYTAVAFWAGWIPAKTGVRNSVLCIAGELALAFVIWACCLMHYKKLVRKMNNQINSL